MTGNPRKSAVLDTTRTMTSQDFSEAIQYERVRSDRFSSKFSVIVVKTKNSDLEAFEQIAEKITDRKRAVDCVGWNQEGSISILLPDTDFKGAKAFGNKIFANDTDDTGAISRSIYTYPDHWLENPRQNENIEALLTNVRSLEKDTVETLFVQKMPLWKRMFDILASTVLLIALSPLFIIVGITIKLVSPGPIFYHQSRIGYRGIPFRFWKFRTMKHGNNQSFHGKHSQSFIKKGDVPMIKLDDQDPRIIPGGKLLRVSCIDELPQLWNVLKGDMSLVGPRPCIPYEAEEYLRWHTHRFDTVPGMTGLWQVSGKNNLTFKEMIRLDIQYCKKVTFFKDLFIFIKTPITVVELVLDAISHRLKRSEDNLQEMPPN